MDILKDEAIRNLTGYKTVNDQLAACAPFYSKIKKSALQEFPELAVMEMS